MPVQNGTSGYVLFPIFPCSVLTLSLVHVKCVVMLQDLVYFFNKAKGNALLSFSQGDKQQHRRAVSRRESVVIQ